MQNPFIPDLMKQKVMKLVKNLSETLLYQEEKGFRETYRDKYACFGAIEKMATQHATYANIIVPGHWVGRKVRAVRIDPETEKEEH